MATPSAPPSIGSVPEPTSSSRTSAGSARARSIDAMLVMCAEKVLRLASIDCSSPMSAKIDRKTGSARAVGRGNAQARLRHQRQQPGGLQRDGLAAGVRPGDRAAPSPAAIDLDRHRHRAALSSGCRAACSSKRAVGRQRRLDRRRSTRRTARACSTSSSVAASIVRCRSPRAAAERVGQRQQDAPDFLALPAPRARRCRC